MWPNSALEGIGYFVSMQDMEWLAREVYGEVVAPPERPDHHLRATTPDSPYGPRPVVAAKRGYTARRAIVVGGGLIGLEVVEILNQAGLEVHFLIMEDWYWPMAIDAAESAWIAEVMRDQGVHVHLQTEVSEFLADENTSTPPPSSNTRS